MTRVVVIALLLIAWALWAQAQSHGGGYLLAVGKLMATDQEAEACHFSLGSSPDAFALVTHQQHIACVRLRELVGKTGVIYFVPDK